MKLFAIGDLHMPGGGDKPMDVFGSHWEDHVQRIFAAWRECVGPEDTVLIPGDISWAMQLPEAAPDLAAIGELPGRKLICRGNHDYWWGTLRQVRSVLPEGMEPIQHTAADLGPCVVTGSRGWAFPTDSEPLSPEDMKVFQRELIRLELGLKAAAGIAQGRPIVVMMHYPPLYGQQMDTPFTRLMEAYGVHTVTYGHLHGQAIYGGFSGTLRGVRYRLVSSDSLGFRLAEIPLGEMGAQEPENNNTL